MGRENLSSEERQFAVREYIEWWLAPLSAPCLCLAAKKNQTYLAFPEMREQSLLQRPA